MLGGGGGIQNDPSSKSISKKTDDITDIPQNDLDDEIPF